MRRRELVTLLGGVAVGWPLAARAQQGDQLRRIGALYGMAETDLEARAWDASFRKQLAELGWTDGRNVRVEDRWTGGNMDRTKQFANELVRLNPDVLVAVTTPATAALQHETSTIPIIFTSVSDPVGSGFVASLPNPGSNITGFINMEASLSGKWVELIREIAPQVSRMAILFNPQTAPFARYYLDTFRSAATALSVESIEAPVHSPAEIEAVMTGIIADERLRARAERNQNLPTKSSSSVTLLARGHPAMSVPWGERVMELRRDPISFAICIARAPASTTLIRSKNSRSIPPWLSPRQALLDRQG